MNTLVNIFLFLTLTFLCVVNAETVSFSFVSGCASASNSSLPNVGDCCLVNETEISSSMDGEAHMVELANEEQYNCVAYIFKTPENATMFDFESIDINIFAEHDDVALQLFVSIYDKQLEEFEVIYDDPVQSGMVELAMNITSQTHRYLSLTEDGWVAVIGICGLESPARKRSLSVDYVSVEGEFNPDLNFLVSKEDGPILMAVLPGGDVFACPDMGYMNLCDVANDQKKKREEDDQELMELERSIEMLSNKVERLTSLLSQKKNIH